MSSSSCVFQQERRQVVLLLDASATAETASSRWASSLAYTGDRLRGESSGTTCGRRNHGPPPLCVTCSTLPDGAS